MNSVSNISIFKAFFTLVPGIAVFISGLAGASADDTGLASIHAWRKERGRTCMIDHFHYGSGTGPTKRTAEKAALDSWTSFTVFEYGTDWGSYNRAGSRIMECQQRGSLWLCNVQARPCRRT